MKQEIAQLQAYLIHHDYDAFLVPTADAHQSEYIGLHDQIRAFLSGFTGSAGTLLVTQEAAYLWTDGRYFEQAQKELEQSGIILMCSGQKGVPDVEDVFATFDAHFTLGLDLNYVSGAWLSAFRIRFDKARIVHDEKMADVLWPNRPARSCKPAWDYALCYGAAAREEKLAMVRKAMAKRQVQGMLVCALDEVAWLLNLRGHDVAYNPVVLSYVLVEEKRATLYIQAEALNEALKQKLTADGVTIRPYTAIKDDLELYDAGTLWYDPDKTNAALISVLSLMIPCLKEVLPIQLWKAVKNAQEIVNTRWAHIKDGLAFTQWMYWLKQALTERTYTEVEIATKLTAFREDQPHFIEPSFATICAYNENAAMMHYQATEQKHAIVQQKGMLLVDSGGHYLEGTTDITRTLILGEVPDIFKVHFTLALKSMLRLQNARFLAGCTGFNLDVLAREPLWQHNLDYQCGTGHGVGHLLNVHEGPNGFRWQKRKDRNEGAVLQPGMITTDEPGVYIPGSHGVRHENELLCVAAQENSYGRFLAFEPLTIAPIDLAGVVPELLNQEEKETLNRYHALVYETLAPYLEAPLSEWLKKITQAI